MVLRYVGIVVVMICLFSGCEKKRKKKKDSAFTIGYPVGAIDNPKIKEASGLVASRTNPGMFWTHNDSGDTSRIFLIDSLGRYKATVILAGVKNRDWEDIAIGKGPDSTKTYMYIGDIGDNFSIYPYKFIYRIEEPRISSDEKIILVTEVDSIKFSLPDRIRDTEALMIDPRSNDLYIFSKREHSINLYALPYPQSTSEPIVAELALADLPFSHIVAADWSADGTEILIKDLSHVYYWKIGNHEKVIDVFQTKPSKLPYEREPQGESIAFDYYGKGYYTLSEKTRGTKPELIFYPRKIKSTRD